MIKPLFVARLKDGTWVSGQSSNSLRGCEVECVLWCRQPTHEQMDEAEPALGEHPERSLLLDTVLSIAYPKLKGFRSERKVP